MNDAKIIKILKICIGIGLFLLLLGHYLISYSGIPERLGVTGIVLSATCIAFGIIFSLPTKIYLTFLLVKRETDKTDIKRETKTDINND